MTKFELEAIFLRFFYANNNSGINPSQIFAEAMTLLRNGLFAVGAFLIIWGLVELGGALGDGGGGGPAIRSAIMRIVGGSIIAAAGGLVLLITL